MGYAWIVAGSDERKDVEVISVEVDALRTSSARNHQDGRSSAISDRPSPSGMTNRMQLGKPDRRARHTLIQNRATTGYAAALLLLVIGAHASATIEKLPSIPIN